MRFRYAISAIALIAAVPAAAQSFDTAAAIERTENEIRAIDRMLQIEAEHGFFMMKDGNNGKVDAITKDEAIQMLTEQTFLGERQGADLPQQVRAMRAKSAVLKDYMIEKRDELRKDLLLLQLEKSVGPTQPTTPPPAPNTITDAGPAPALPADGRGGGMGEALPASVLAGLSKPPSSEFQPAPVEPQPTAVTAAPARPPRPKISAAQIGQLAGAFGNLIAGIRGNSGSVPRPSYNPYGAAAVGAPVTAYNAPAATYAAPAAASGWAGRYDLDGFGPVVVTGEGAGLAGEWRSTDNNHVTRVGNCNVVGNQAQCATAGSFRDPILVDVDYQGTLTITLTGTGISGTHTITQATQSWHTDPFNFPLRQGATIPVNMRRVN